MTQWRGTLLSCQKRRCRPLGSRRTKSRALRSGLTISWTSDWRTLKPQMLSAYILIGRGQAITSQVTQRHYVRNRGMGETFLITTYKNKTSFVLIQHKD